MTERALHIGESCAFAAGPSVAPISRALAESAASHGWRFTTRDAKLSAQVQAGDIAKLVELGVDAIVSFPLEPTVVEPAQARAAERGVEIFALGAASPAARTVIRQDCDGAGVGEDAASFIADRVPAARVIVIGGPPAPALAARVEHFLRAAGDRGLELLAREDNVGDVRSTALPIARRLLDRHPDADAIWCFNDYTALAAADALAERSAASWSGERRGVIVSGIGGMPEAIAAVAAGGITSTYDSRPVETGRAAIDLIRRGVGERGQIPREVRIDSVRCDRSNVTDFVPWAAR